ncbi:PEP/pyruvate-binding domain-containing protein [Natronorubrum sp. FCH18a]|uniref:PEP/pyruvate-binding domain-containing protein n=1 Tax=Natronorubrum sp. FCH18a TaxID=3447018 RepID=UPI003F51842C
MTDRDRPRTSGPYVVSLTDPEATDRALVGGKSANLARLTAAGMPVPSGFCVTTVAYRRLVDDEALRDSIGELSDLDPTDTEAIAAAGAAVRERIRDLEVPAEVRDAIENAYDEHASGPEDAYAVRSSATAEDLPEASFAGQQETFLNVRGIDDLVDRVRACVASLFTDRAIAYRARNDISHEEVALSVAVQRMLEPDTSGILFTADPTTGNRRITSIEAGLGLGEALVSGAATADSVRFDTRSADIVDYEVNDQRVAVRSNPEGGTETIELRPRDRTKRVLTDEQVRTLAALGEDVEELFGRPQDVEWCLEDGDVYLVQSRPITSLFPVPSPEPDDDRLHVYVSLGHAQAFAEAMPPLVRDIWLSYTQTTFAEFGFGAETQWAAEAGGRVYMDVTTFLRTPGVRNGVPNYMAGTSEPMGDALEDLLERRGDAFRDDRSVVDTVAAAPTLAGSAWTATKASVPFVSSMLDGLPGAFVGDPALPANEEAKWTAWGTNIAAAVRATDDTADRVRAVFDSLDEAIDFPPAGPLFAALIAGEVLAGLFPDAPEDVNAVGRGFPNEVVTRINLGLGDLADVARAHPAVADALRRDASLEEIESVDGGEVFAAALEEFLAEFGHRATGEIDVSRPRWCEDPSGLIATVRANLEHGAAGEHREHVRQMQREAIASARRLEHRADRGALGPIRRRLVRRLVRTYRGYIQTREYPKQGAAYMFAAWRDVLREAGETLATQGTLDAAEDVWFLRADELLAALAGDPIEVDIGVRRAEFECYASMDAPPVLTSEGEAPSPKRDREDVPDGALVGTGVSGGVVEGRARVVRDPTEETIEKGEILVAPSSDPGWTPLFLNASGMVVEVGGRMSHGALVAREYGLPAVVSVSEATRRIETGQRIRVDGTNGTVELLE